MTIYVLETAALSAGHWDILTQALPPERRKRAEGIPHTVVRQESVAAAYLALYGLVAGDTGGGLRLCRADSLVSKAKTVGMFARSTGWPVDERGKPFPQGITANGCLLYVSLSHSKGLAAAAIADVPLGMDAQCLPTESAEQLLRIAGKFHPHEKEALSALPETALPAAFCRLWACKESVMKLCGRGLSLPLSSFCIINENTSELEGRAIRLYTESINNAVFAAAVWADTL